MCHLKLASILAVERRLYTLCTLHLAPAYSCCPCLLPWAQPRVRRRPDFCAILPCEGLAHLNSRRTLVPTHPSLPCPAHGCSRNRNHNLETGYWPALHAPYHSSFAFVFVFASPFIIHILSRVASIAVYRLLVLNLEVYNILKLYMAYVCLPHGKPQRRIYYRSLHDTYSPDGLAFRNRLEALVQSTRRVARCGDDAYPVGAPLDKHHSMEHPHNHLGEGVIHNPGAKPPFSSLLNTCILALHHRLP